MAFESLTDKLKARQSEGLLRAPVVIEDYQGQHIRVAGKAYINFSSNDYLGLAQHPELLNVTSQQRLHTGSGGSPLVTGHSAAHQQLIDFICEHTNREAGMLCNSGFAANFAVLQALIQEDDLVIMDKLAHASMIDGALASAGQMQRFKHNDIEHLEIKLKQLQADNVLVATEGVFSMDGDKAPLHQMAQLCQTNNAWLMADDAHAIGIVGECGFGHADSDGLSQQQLPVWMATFGKAVGTGGAIICGSDTLISYLNNFARHYIYSTAMSPQQVAVTYRSLQLMIEEQWRREKLQELATYFQTEATRIGLRILPSQTAIQPIIIGDPQKAMKVSQQLKEKGIWVSAIRSPTVPVGTDRLRVTLTAHHDLNNIDYLLTCLQEVWA